MLGADLIAYVLFGAIGMGAFVYGRKQREWKPTAIAIALMVYPYVISGTLLLYLIGIFFTLALFVFRD